MRTTIYIAALSFGLCFLMAHCSTKKANSPDGKLLKDKEGHYYKVSTNVGDNLFLNEINLEDYAKF